jgi:hypothetical protein
MPDTSLVKLEGRAILVQLFRHRRLLRHGHVVLIYVHVTVMLHLVRYVMRYVKE